MHFVFNSRCLICWYTDRCEAVWPPFPFPVLISVKTETVSCRVGGRFFITISIILIYFVMVSNNWRWLLCCCCWSLAESVVCQFGCSVGTSHSVFMLLSWCSSSYVRTQLAHKFSCARFILDRAELRMLSKRSTLSSARSWFSRACGIPAHLPDH